MARHHRERIIQKKKRLFDAVWWGGYTQPLGTLAKHSTHHRKCEICHYREYDRAKEKEQYRNDVGL